VISTGWTFCLKTEWFKAGRLPVSAYDRNDMLSDVYAGMGGTKLPVPFKFAYCHR